MGHFTSLKMSRIPEWVVNHKERERETSSICLVLRSLSDTHMKHVAKSRPKEKSVLLLLLLLLLRVALHRAQRQPFCLFCPVDFAKFDTRLPRRVQGKKKERRHAPA